MDRSRLSQILLVAAVFFLVWTLFGKGCGKDKGPNTSIVQETYDVQKLPEGTKLGAACVIDTPDFRATVGPTGGGLQSFSIKGAKYTDGNGQIDLAHRTTIDLQGSPISYFAPMRVQLRNDPSQTQVSGDLLEFDVQQKDATTCVLTHRTGDLVEVVRTVKATGRPYEISLETKVTNLAAETRKHAFSSTLFALQFKKDEGGLLSRPGPNDVFSAACAHDGGKLERKDKGALREWFLQNGAVDYVSVTSSYLGQAIAPDASDANAHCALVAQDFEKDKPTEQALFRAVLAYDAKELAPNASATYRQTAFFGPKERHILAAAMGGGRHLDQLIDLGMFAVIARYLVSYVVILKGLIGSWGVAIILLTITVRVALLPLTLPQIKSSISMRRLKPELDELTKKFEGDAQAKMLATSQLYKKHGVSPLAGCLPALAQMPVWFALYTALQTAIELYHEKFAIWTDLSSPDPRYILPIVLGAAMYVQQKVTPMQMDPAQQKVMTYLMPAMFTVFMLFLPAGLGVYMLTNSVLGIVQTIAVERYYKSTQPAQVKVTVTTTPKPDKDREPRPAKELARRKD